MYIVTPGANPTIVSYNASAVEIHNATSSLVRFEGKNIFLYIEETALVYYICIMCSCKF
jgi:hypothetical protein